MTRPHAPLLVAGALLLGASGCAGCVSGAARQAERDLQTALETAWALEDAGHYELARQQLAQLAVYALPDEREIAWLRICNTWQRQGEPLEARRCYLELAPRLFDRERAAEALYHASEYASDEQRAVELEGLLVEYGDTRTARRALFTRRELARRAGGCAAEAAELARLASRVAAAPSPGDERLRDTLVADVVVGRGRALLECDDVAGAARVLAEARELAGGTVLWDDASHFLGVALQRLGRHVEALAVFTSIVEARQEAWFFGSYDSVYLDDAWLAAGEELEALGRASEAREVYDELVEERPTSRLADDAAFRSALIAAQQGEPQALRRFVERFPESRHARRARELMGHAGDR